MEMTIDQAINCLNGPCKGCEIKSCIMPESVDLAVDIMRKYQKIEQIRQKWFEEWDYPTSRAWFDVREVMEDGNDRT